MDLAGLPALQEMVRKPQSRGVRMMLSEKNYRVRALSSAGAA